MIVELVKLHHESGNHVGSLSDGELLAQADSGATVERQVCPTRLQASVGPSVWSEFVGVLAVVLLVTVGTTHQVTNASALFNKHRLVTVRATATRQRRVLVGKSVVDGHRRVQSEHLVDHVLQEGTLLEGLEGDVLGFS